MAVTLDNALTNSGLLKVYGSLELAADSDNTGGHLYVYQGGTLDIDAAVTGGWITNVGNHGTLELSDDGAWNPAPPKALEGQASSANEIDLDWQDQGTATDYGVYRAAPGDTSYTLIGTTGGDTSFADTDVDPGTQYTYVIVTVRTDITGTYLSAATDPVTVTTPQE